MSPLRTKTTCCEFHAEGGAYGSKCSPLPQNKAPLPPVTASKKKTRKKWFAEPGKAEWGC